MKLHQVKQCSTRETKKNDYPIILNLSVYWPLGYRHFHTYLHLFIVYSLHYSRSSIAINRMKRIVYKISEENSAKKNVKEFNGERERMEKNDDFTLTFWKQSNETEEETETG